MISTLRILPPQMTAPRLPTEPTDWRAVLRDHRDGDNDDDATTMHAVAHGELSEVQATELGWTGQDDRLRMLWACQLATQHLSASLDAVSSRMIALETALERETETVAAVHAEYLELARRRTLLGEESRTIDEEIGRCDARLKRGERDERRDDPHLRIEVDRRIRDDAEEEDDDDKRDDDSPWDSSPRVGPQLRPAPPAPPASLESFKVASRSRTSTDGGSVGDGAGAEDDDGAGALLMGSLRD